MAGRLEGKVALITGGGSGIGDATAHLFASEGAKVVVADLKIDAAKNVADAVVSDGGDAVALAGDVAARADCEAMVAGTVEQYGRIDVLINSAGVTPRYAPAEWDWEQKWDWTIGINLKGSMMMSYFAVEQMKEQGSGSIVNMASVIGLVGYADGMSDGFHPYPHSKGGVVQMTRDMGVALAREGIRVNSPRPLPMTPICISASSRSTRLAGWARRSRLLGQRFSSPRTMHRSSQGQIWQ